MKPYQENTFGVSSLRLLHALRPITALHLVTKAHVHQLWCTEIPQMLQMLYGEGLWELDEGSWAVGLTQKGGSPEA